jgi:membrane-associated phospholipid phosphatase
LPVSEKKYNFAKQETKGMKRFAHLISFVFHPLLMVTYGFSLALGYTYLAAYPSFLKLYMAGGVVLFTVLIPAAIVVLMVKGGIAKDLELSDRRERVIPYLTFIAGNMVCIYYMYRFHLPGWMLSIFTGACAALFASLFINFAWKISAHALGVGGLLGAIMGVAHIYLLNPYPLFITVILMAGLTGTARIILEKHTPMQVYAGFGLGFLCTFAASYMNLMNVMNLFIN